MLELWGAQGPSPIVLVIGAAVFASSFISGLFGSAGGALLLGALMIFLDVPTAMILYGVNQIVSNLSRSVLWFSFIQWRLIWRYMIAACAVVALMRLVVFVPDKAIVYLCLGGLPFLVRMLPAGFAPSISDPRGQYKCGAFVTSVQMVAGGGCGTLELFFQNADLGRKQIVATKAAIQTLTTLLRIAYFGSLATAGSIGLGMSVFSAGVTLCATFLAGYVLHRMSDEAFKGYTRFIISAIGLSLVGKGAWLLVMRV